MITNMTNPNKSFSNHLNDRCFNFYFIVSLLFLLFNFSTMCPPHRGDPVGGVYIRGLPIR